MTTEARQVLTVGWPWAMEATWETVLGLGEAHLGDLNELERSWTLT
jgi:hypothetical protein